MMVPRLVLDVNVCTAAENNDLSRFEPWSENILGALIIDIPDIWYPTHDT